MKPLKTWSILFLVCSLLLGCKDGPRVSFCVMGEDMLYCSDPDKVAFTKSYAEASAESYGCMAPDDWEKLLENGVKTSSAIRAVKKEYQTRVAAHPVMSKKWKRN